MMRVFAQQRTYLILCIFSVNIVVKKTCNYTVVYSCIYTWIENQILSDLPIMLLNKQLLGPVINLHM